MTDDARKAESLIDSWQSVTLGTEARAEVKDSLARALRERPLTDRWNVERWSEPLKRVGGTMNEVDRQARAERLVRIETGVDAGQPTYEVRLVVGVQSFKINFVHESLEEAEWMKKRLVKALVRAMRDTERAVWREAAETINGYAEQLGFSRHHAQLLADRLRQRAAEEG